jgi:glycosyltransferase involved in cell wall biosynthesis
MKTNLPLVSIIMATFNRAYIIARAIDSVLNQSYRNLELIIVDDGSADNTSDILMKYHDPRIRIFKHEKNRGATAAKNTGIKQIKGEWFTTFDSDDEMVPTAIETMIKIPLSFDQTITSVVCNCWEPISKTFLGQGLSKDGYIEYNEIMPLCKGDFWGLLKTSLLKGDSFNENLLGNESTLWYKINGRAKGYYIHQALNIVHIEGNDRVSNLNILKVNFPRQILHYENIINEELYLKIIKKLKPDEYYHLCRAGLFMMRINKNNYLASKYCELLKPLNNSFLTELAIKYEVPIIFYKTYFILDHPIRKEVSQIKSTFFKILNIKKHK